MRIFSKLSFWIISWSLRSGRLKRIWLEYAWQRQYFIGFTDCWHTTSPSILQKNNKLGHLSHRGPPERAHNISSPFRPATLLALRARKICSWLGHLLPPWPQSLASQAMQTQVHVLVYHCTRIIRIQQPLVSIIASRQSVGLIFEHALQFLHWIINIQILAGQVNRTDEIITQPEQFDMEHTFIYFRSLRCDDRCQLMYMEV